MGIALEAAGRHEEADASLAQAQKLGRDAPDVCVAVARALTAHGREPEAAVLAARRACGLDVNSADARDALAQALHSTGSYQAALGPAEEAVRLAPREPQYRYNLGLLREALGDRAGARERFAHALELAPDFDEAQEALRRLDGAL